jgi:hypothetical protein
LEPGRSERSAGAGPSSGACSPSRGRRGRWRATTWSRTPSMPSSRAPTSKHKISARPSRCLPFLLRVGGPIASAALSIRPRCAHSCGRQSEKTGAGGVQRGICPNRAEKKSARADGFRHFETRVVGVYGNLKGGPRSATLGTLFVASVTNRLRARLPRPQPEVKSPAGRVPPMADITSLPSSLSSTRK